MNRNKVYDEIIIAGFGGQGIMLAGRLLAQAAMKQGLEVTYMSSYGAEVRGGAANCMVIISDEPIASPLVTNPTSLIAMSKAAVRKFGKDVKKGGLVVVNSSLIDELPDMDNTVETVKVPADEFAVELGNIRVANMAALGAYIAKKNILDVETVCGALSDVLAKRYQEILPVNIAAIKRGAEFVGNPEAV